MFKVFKDGQLPTRGTKFSACVDLHARENVIIEAGKTALIPLGVSIDLKSLWHNTLGQKPEMMSHKEMERYKTLFLNEHYLQLMLRSSLSKEFIIANGVGIVDLDYEDEIMLRIYRPFKGGGLATFKREIKKGDRVAQITLLEHKSYLFGIDTEDERTGGFGSTKDK